MAVVVTDRVVVLVSLIVSKTDVVGFLDCWCKRFPVTVSVLVMVSVGRADGIGDGNGGGKRLVGDQKR